MKARRLWRPLSTIRATTREIRLAIHLGADWRSRGRLATDVVLFRLLSFISLPNRDRPRRIRLRHGSPIVYRLNRGDIQSVREIFMDGAYRLPFARKFDAVVDLGANIGLTSLYYHRSMKPEIMIAVEPDRRNVELARVNLTGTSAVLLQAAIGPRDGAGHFLANEASNLGRLASKNSGEGELVDVISMDSVLAQVPSDAAVLVKLDIEGGEDELLRSNTDWLSRVSALIVEFHPDRVDYPGLVGILRDAGFEYVPAGSRWTGQMDAFCRPDLLWPRVAPPGH